MIPLMAGPALAADEEIEGYCGFASYLVEGRTIRTVAGSGTSIRLKYTNGMGLTNSISLRISPISVKTGSAFAGTTVVGPKTGGTYTLATDVLQSTRFTLNFRSSSDVTVDDHWKGTLYW